MNLDSFIEIDQREDSRHEFSYDWQCFIFNLVAVILTQHLTDLNQYFDFIKVII